MQCREKSLDPALLDLADVNIRKFRLAFPREGRIAGAEKDYAEMLEIFAEHLMETGRFFQKTKKTPASIIYYSKVLSKYPETPSGKRSKRAVGKPAGFRRPINRCDSSFFFSFCQAAATAGSLQFPMPMRGRLFPFPMFSGDGDGSLTAEIIRRLSYLA